MDEVALSQALQAVWEVVGEANRFLVEREPWAVAKDPARREELSAVLYAAAEVLRVLAVFISPIMPRAASNLWAQLGMAEGLAEQRLPHASQWGLLTPGTRTDKGESLFPRLEE
jgi:methionyl-tRNA synthetase